MQLMVKFSNTPKGRRTRVLFGGLACLFAFSSVKNLFHRGWRSIEWIAWLLLAFSFFCLAIFQSAEGLKSERSKRAYSFVVIGFAVLGFGVMVYSSIFSK